MLALLDERSLGEITVAELCARAGVSRVAFYDRFGTIDELCIAAMETELLKVRDAAAAIDTAGTRPAEQPPTDLVEIFVLVDAHASLYRAMLGSGGSMAFLHRMRDTLALAVAATLHRLPGIEHWPVRPRAYVDYVTGAVISAILGWLFDAEPLPPAEAAREFWWLLTHRPERLGAASS